MAPVCLFYRMSPQDFWSMRARDAADLFAFMAREVDARESRDRMTRVKSQVAAKAGGRAGR